MGNRGGGGCTQMAGGHGGGLRDTTRIEEGYGIHKN